MLSKRHRRRLFTRSVDDVRAMIAGSGGPRSNGVTQAATVRLHDDKSTYTGAELCSGRRQVRYSCEHVEGTEPAAKWCQQAMQSHVAHTHH